MKRLRILFVCGRNQWRSPTAERLFRNDPRVEVRSAGVSRQSRRTIGEKDIDWADLILALERRYGVTMRERFGGRELPRIESLEIPDEFEYMDAELVALLEERVEAQIRDFELNQ